MKKSELINRLKKIKGDPDIMIEDESVETLCPLSELIVLKAGKKPDYENSPYEGPVYKTNMDGYWLAEPKQKVVMIRYSGSSYG